MDFSRRGKSEKGDFKNNKKFFVTESMTKTKKGAEHKEDRVELSRKTDQKIIDELIEFKDKDKDYKEIKRAADLYNELTEAGMELLVKTLGKKYGFLPHVKTVALRKKKTEKEDLAIGWGFWDFSTFLKYLKDKEEGKQRLPDVIQEAPPEAQTATEEPPHPGKILRDEFIDAKNIKVKDLAMDLGVERVTLSYLLSGRNGISPEMAISLGERFKEYTAEQWINFQGNYDLAKARKKRASLPAKIHV